MLFGEPLEVRLDLRGSRVAGDWRVVREGRDDALDVEGGEVCWPEAAAVGDDGLCGLPEIDARAFFRAPRADAGEEECGNCGPPPRGFGRAISLC